METNEPNKTVQETKNSLANRMGYKDWAHCIDHYITEGVVGTLLDDVAKLYAQSQTEALRDEIKNVTKYLELSRNSNKLYEDENLELKADNERAKELLNEVILSTPFNSLNELSYRIEDFLKGDKIDQFEPPYDDDPIIDPSKLGKTQRFKMVPIVDTAESEEPVCSDCGSHDLVKDNIDTYCNSCLLKQPGN